MRWASDGGSVNVAGVRDGRQWIGRRDVETRSSVIEYRSTDMSINDVTQPRSRVDLFKFKFSRQSAISQQRDMLIYLPLPGRPAGPFSMHPVLYAPVTGSQNSDRE